MEEVAWLAGLFEGEGYIFYASRSWRMGITMTDEDVIREAHRVAVVGKVYGPYEGKGNRKPSWRWQVSNRREVEQVAMMIRPYLFGRRKQQVDECLGNPVRHPTRLKGDQP